MALCRIGSEGCIQIGPSGWGSVYPLDPAIFQIKLVHDFSLRTGPLSVVETKNNTQKKYTIKHSEKLFKDD